MNPFVASSLVLVTLSLLFAAARYACFREWMSAEYSRKFVHVGMGCLCLNFPWLFHDARLVIALAIVATLALLGVRTIPWLQTSFSCVLHGVRRRSFGEFAFIGGVAAAFTFAQGDALSYVIPVAVLTFADTAAAIVGVRFGTHRFDTIDGSKSLEGSTAFLATAVACVAVPLAIAGRSGAVAIALLTGLLLMVVEAAAWAGLDNFAIPFVGGFLVRALIGSATGSAF